MPRRFPAQLYRVGEEPDPRFSFANERTFLAWIRTSLAMLAGGVALEALPLEINSILRITVSTGLVALGILSSVYAWWAWYRAERAMRLEHPLPGSFGVAPLTIGLALTGSAIAVALWVS
ncbi:hypothetical protein CJ177_41500 [Rhodococcus sp. ACPA1]|nr:hypothetical protein CJ177_41500 [Rhodococcus sp. ACPA1]